MASGSKDFTKSTGTAGRLRLHVAWSQPGNSTRFDWAFYIQCTDSLTVIYSPGTNWDVNAAGTNADDGKFTWAAGGGERKIASGTVTKNHDANGRLGSQSFKAEIGDTGTQGLGGPATATGSINPPRIPVTPSAPRNLSVGSVGARSAVASFDAPSDNGGASINDYSVRVATNPQLNGYTGYGNGTNRSVNLTGLNPGTKYYAAVIAHNSVGWGAQGSVVSFTTDPVTPSAPRNLSVGSVGEKTATVSFDAPSDTGGASIDDYRVRVSTHSNMSGYVGFGSGTDRTVNITGLNPGTRYWVQVLAHNSAGWGATSSTVSFTTNVARPSAPRNVSVGNVDKRTARVSFSAPSDNGGGSINNYRTRISTSSNMSGASSVTGSSPVNLTSLQPNTDYWVDVQAHNSAGWGPRSSTVKFTTNPAGMKVWNGSSWVDGTVKVWNGSSWVDGTVKVWNGSSWVDGS